MDAISKLKVKMVDAQVAVEDVVTKIHKLVCRHEWVAVIPNGALAKFCAKCESTVLVTIPEWLEVFNNVHK